MPGLDRLHPGLQKAIVEDLGWPTLRPVQHATIDAVLDGANAVVLAPTAGGKTEAAVFPLLSRMLSEQLAPVSVLYLCPLRALLNNQEARLRGYARLVGRSVFKWHGEVPTHSRKAFEAHPADLLLTTPESLEVMLMSARTDAPALFAGLHAVVVDEVHAFAGDDRGAHLAAVLERLSVLAGRDLQRVGLSATVGNPQRLGQWLQGSSARPAVVVDLPRPPPRRELALSLCADVEEAATGLAHLAKGKKSLVFVESRASAEKAAQALAGRGVEVFIHHSSVSREDRAQAEERFAAGRNTAIVATSTLELGIDVGDLDQVMQLDAPASVAAFLQRLGRAGRRGDTPARCAFFCLTGEALLRATAVVRLAQRGWVEDVRPPGEAMHVLAHQVLALVLQEGGLSRHKLWGWVAGAAPFQGVSEARLQGLVEVMLARELLHEAAGKLSLGLEGERRYGRKHFFELCAVFSAPPSLRVVHGEEEVGFLQASFLSLQDQRGEPLCFRLGGRAWELDHVDFAKGVAKVRPARAGRVPSWLGLAGTLSYPVCQAMREVLLEPGDEALWLDRSAQQALAEQRALHAPLFAEGPAPLEERPEGGVQWHTFAGGAINRLLAAALQEATREHWVAGNLSLKCAQVTKLNAAGAVRWLPQVDWDALALREAAGLARGVVSKFQPCLPEEEEARLLVGKWLDVEGTRAFASLSPRAGRGSG